MGRFVFLCFFVACMFPLSGLDELKPIFLPPPSSILLLLYFLHPLIFDLLGLIPLQLQNHTPALHLLAQTLRDPISAEAYCTQGGEVLPAHVLSSIASSLNLSDWAELGGGAMKRRMTVSEGTRKDLLMTLLRIYMGQGEG